MNLICILFEELFRNRIEYCAQFVYNCMRRRTNSLSVKVKALESLKKISEECYDLTSPALVTPAKPLLCQVDLFNRSTPLIDGSPLVPRSAPVAQTARTIAAHDPRATSAFDIGSPLIETETFCKKVYTTRLIETQAKQNGRQKSLFIRKLTKAVNGSVLNASGYELGPLGIREIGQFLQKNSMIELILDRNNLKDQGVLQLAKVVGKLRLKHLSLASVGMTQRSCKTLIIELAKMESLEQLNLSSQEGFNRNRLHRDAFKDICLLTGTGNGKTNLKILKCGGVGLDDSNFKALCLGLGRGSRLQILSMEENEVTSEGMAYFKQHAVKLHMRFLDLSANKIDGGGLIELASLIGDDYNLTKISKSLHILKASKSKIRSGSLATFAKAMHNNQTLEELYLDCNPLGEGGKFNTFTNFLSRCWSIKKLSLCQSLRSTEEVLLLCESLQNNRGVETLFISRNSLQYCAFKKLMDVLSRNKSLKKVHLESCGIVDSYILRAQQTMLQLKYLQELYLDHNFINDKAAAVLEKVLFRNKSIVRLQLHNNSVGVKLQEQIERALNYNIQAKKFDGPDLSYYAYLQEQQAQQKNALQSVIHQLKQKESNLNCRQLLHAIAKRDLQTNHRAIQLRKEAAEVEKIAQIKENLKKIQEMERKVGNSQSLPIAQSVISFGQFSNPTLSKQVSQQPLECSVSQSFSHLSQTH